MTMRDAIKGRVGNFLSRPGKGKPPQIDAFCGEEIRSAVASIEKKKKALILLYSVISPAAVASVREIKG